jgi:hypothetical protein
MQIADVLRHLLVLAMQIEWLRHAGDCSACSWEWLLGRLGASAWDATSVQSQRTY